MCVCDGAPGHERSEQVRAGLSKVFCAVSAMHDEWENIADCLGLLMCLFVSEFNVGTHSN